MKKEKEGKKDGKKDEKKPFSKLPEVTDELDEFDRPMHKVHESNFVSVKFQYTQDMTECSTVLMDLFVNEFSLSKFSLLAS